MNVPRFVRFAHRSTDPERARAFYEALFGSPIANADDGTHAISIVRLPERAIANGARPHWLGLVAVDDPAQTATRFLAPGTAPLASVAGADGRPATVVVRDPFGALLGFTSVAPTAAASPARWHQHHGNDARRAIANYVEVLGWTPAGVADLGPPIGPNLLAAWDGADPAVGFAAPAADAGIHSQWLHFFATDDLDRARALAREAGGIALEPVGTPDGHRLAACDDPLGAAFGLIERAR